MTEYIAVINLFFIYAVIGWLWETFYCSFRAKKFVYRGFLIGPYCPVYGFGVLSVLYLVEPYQNNLFVLFIFSTVLVTVLEFLTSYFLEKLFHTTWWDYHHLPFNIQGRVALPISLFWGAGCVLITEVIHPRIMSLESVLEAKLGWYLPIAIVLVMGADTIYTVINMISFQKALKKWSQALEEGKAEFLAKKAEFSEELKEKSSNLAKNSDKERPLLIGRNSEFMQVIQKKKESLPSFSFNQRRVLKSFEDLKHLEVNNMSELRELLKEIWKK